MAKITTYDSHTARTIAQFVRDQQRKAPRRLNNDLSNQRNPRVIRWAKATTNAKYPTYPTSGTVFISQLGDYEVSDTATVEPNQDIDREFTEFGTSEADYVIVLCADGTSLPTQDAIVRIELHDGQWIYKTDSATVRKTDIANVKNTSGSSKRAGDLLASASTIVTTLSTTYPYTAINGTTADYDKTYGVCLESIATNAIGEVQFAGVVAAYVYIADTSHVRAVANGTATLRSNNTGPVEIIYAPASTGEQLCLVRLGTAPTLNPIYRAPDLSGSFTFGASPYKMSLLSTQNDDSLWTINGGLDEITCNRDGWYRVSIAIKPYQISGSASERLHSYITQTPAGATSAGVLPITPLSNTGEVLRDTAIMEIASGDVIKWYVSYTGGSWGTVAGGASDFTAELLRDRS